MSFTDILTRFAKGVKGPAETVISTGLGFGSQIVFEPPLQAAANEMWREFPNRPLTPAELAQLYRRGYMGLDQARSAALDSGLNVTRFDQLVHLTDQLLSASEALTLLAKGSLTEDEALHHMVAAGYTDGDARRLIEARYSEPALGEMLQLINRGELSDSEAIRQLQRSGLSPDMAHRLLGLRVTEPSVTVIWAAVNRGYMSEAAGAASLRKQGFEASVADAMMRLREAFPTPSDLVRFAVREVFTPAVRDRYGLDEDLPPEFITNARKAGLGPEAAGWYWAAHWELPSLTNGFDMYQRSIITLDDLKLLMRSQDVMPFWRDKLIQLAFAPLTRVDVRRMFKAGVIDRERVYRAYLDLGYSPDNAKALTDWTTQEGIADTKDFSKAEVISLYESRAIDETTAQGHLTTLGYSAADAGMLLKLAEYRRAKAIRDKAVGVVRNRYIAKKITKEVADNLLDQLEVAADEKTDLLKIWDLERDATTADLTVAQMQALWKRAEITDEEFDADMIRRGYEPYEATWLRILATKPASASTTGTTT